ncbi:MAG: hypothetical protein VB120_06825 [Lachnospiraceae bacterium]|nr:hypothetical protein [Lachnospiraceae bacterium]
MIYGLAGWTMEIVWTGIASLLKGDLMLKSSTSLWMFLIYGSAVFLEPLFSLLEDSPVVLRGGLYMLSIFLAEFATGMLLQKTAGCPWDYGTSKYSINGIIRLDYAPVWFAVGLIFEKLYFVLTAI